MLETTLSLTRPTPDQLLGLMGVTPADNPGGAQSPVHWKSFLGGYLFKQFYTWEELLGQLAQGSELTNPWSWLAASQQQLLGLLVTQPVQRQARMAARIGETPDPFMATNIELERRYSALLYELCDYFMEQDRFSREKARQECASLKGVRFLVQHVLEFASLEYSYQSLGLTRICALKEMLKALLMLITEQPMSGRHPYRTYDEQGEPREDFDAYLNQLAAMMENLHRCQAFDLMAFSENHPAARMGASSYSIVKHSPRHGVRLRHYHPSVAAAPDTDASAPSRPVVYLNSPLINRPEILDLAPGKSVIEGLLNRGYDVYMVDYGNPGPEEAELGLAFYGKEIHDHYLELIGKRHPGQPLLAMGYCMGGTLLVPYLARRAQERERDGLPMDVQRLVLMTTPVLFDDADSGMKPMRDLIRQQYDAHLMETLFGDVNIPPQLIDFGMNEIQPGVRYTVTRGLFQRAAIPGAIEDAAPFLNWLYHGTRFPATAHREWIEKVFLGNQIFDNNYRLPSRFPELDQQPVDMNALAESGVAIMDYRGERDPISPVGACRASQAWGSNGTSKLNRTAPALNRTIEKNIGHIFVVSQKHLQDFLERVDEFFHL